jgi:hypothetical protein
VIIDTTLSTGDYFFKVEGVGNTYAPNYAILGSYSVQGQLVEAPLALHQLNLSGHYSNGRHLLNWAIDADEEIAQQVIEYSLDGKSFTALATPSADARSFAWVPFATGDIAYRVHVTFDNNSNHYSNTIVIRDAQSPRPKLVSTMVNGNHITVSSPGIYDYALYNMNGQVITKGKLSAGMNRLGAEGLITGMYLVRYSNSDQQWIDRFVKQ